MHPLHHYRSGSDSDEPSDRLHPIHFSWTVQTLEWTKSEDRCSVPWSDSRVWQCLDHRPFVQALHRHRTLAGAVSLSFVEGSPIHKTQGWWHQLLAETGKWLSRGISLFINTIQQLHQWLPCHIMPQIHLCTRHLLCPASQNINLIQMSHYCRRWCLKPSPTNTVSGVFHINNSIASRELSVIMDGQWLKHECFPWTSVW